MENKLSYDRILLKISGEFFQGKEKPLSFRSLESVTSQIKNVHATGVKLGVVVGGGNIIRGARESKETDLPPEELDGLGMEATILNGGALSLHLKKFGVPNTVISAIPVLSSIGEHYDKHRVEYLLSLNHVLIFVGGTGNPYFTTDTASVLRAIQMGADVLLKATNVSGVYDKDPKACENAHLYRRLTYKEALDKGLGIMDSTAFSMAWTNNLLIVVFDATVPGNIERVVRGEEVGTIIEGGTTWIKS